LSLLANAPLPVLAVSAGAVPDFGKASFRMLVADDFLESTQEAVRKAFELAAGLEQAEVRQLYVHGDFRELIRSRWEELKCRFPGPASASLTPESFWEKEYQALLAKGRAQGGPSLLQAERAGTKVDLDVRTSNDVAAELDEVLREFSPDLVVFGRHRVLRARPFLIGRMPFKTMLQLGKAVLVVPPSTELFARLPLPAAPPSA
jgi:nucleotide-binding universal stress UspA family protein